MRPNAEDTAGTQKLHQATVAASNVGTVCVAALCGEVDMANADDVYDVLRSAFDTSGCGGLTVDLSELSFLGSDGIRILVKLQRYVRASGADLTVTHPSPTVANVLKVTGVSRMLGLA